MASAGKKSSKIFVWIILVLLILGLAGFGANSLGGQVASIGSVGKTEITVDQYVNALRQQMQQEQRRTGAPVTFAEVAERGLDVRARTSLVSTAAIIEEARVMGLSVGDAAVARQLREIPSFQGPDGSFDRDAYNFALERNQTTPAEFEDTLRADASMALLQQAVTGGVTASDTYAQTLYNFIGETRSFRWAALEDAILVDEAPAPTDADLATFHTENASLFERPEIRKITYAWLTPELLLEEISVEEQVLLDLYEERAEEFNQPERRLVERIAFVDQAAADAAKAQIDAGETTFDAVVEGRGLTLEDVDQGEVARADLDAAIADVVFALEEPGVTEPVQTSFGPALYRVNALLEATTTPFEDVREELLRETTADRAARAIEDEIDPVDDLLVGGATIEELADETSMQLGQIDFSFDVSDGIAAYDGFRQIAQSATTDDFPEVQTLSDGGIFALRLDEIVPPALPPLEEIRAEVEEAWIAQQTRDRLVELGNSLKAQLDAGTAMEALGLAPQIVEDQTRSSRPDGTPLALISTVFELEENGTAVVESGDEIALVELTSITLPDLEDERATALLPQFNAEASRGLASDIFQLYAQAVQARHQVSLDLNAINLVQRQLAGGGGY